MGHINVQYKKEFTEKFKAACKKLGVSQSEGKRSIIRTYDKNHFQVHLTVSMGMVLHTKLLMDFF